MREASSRAMVEFVGIPSDRRGMKEPEGPELLADSGPATPSIIPVPNFSGCLDIFFSRAYDMVLEMTVFPPGITPTKNPSTVPRTMGQAESFQSRRLGKRFLIFPVRIPRKFSSSR